MDWNRLLDSFTLSFSPKSGIWIQFDLIFMISEDLALDFSIQRHYRDVTRRYRDVTRRYRDITRRYRDITRRYRDITRRYTGCSTSSCGKKGSHEFPSNEWSLMEAQRHPKQSLIHGHLKGIPITIFWIMNSQLS